MFISFRVHQIVNPDEEMSSSQPGRVAIIPVSPPGLGICPVTIVAAGHCSCRAKMLILASHNIKMISMLL